MGEKNNCGGTDLGGVKYPHWNISGETNRMRGYRFPSCRGSSLFSLLIAAPVSPGKPCRNSCSLLPLRAWPALQLLGSPSQHRCGRQARFQGVRHSKRLILDPNDKWVTGGQGAVPQLWILPWSTVPKPALLWGAGPINYQITVKTGNIFLARRKHAWSHPRVKREEVLYSAGEGCQSCWHVRPSCWSCSTLYE